MLRRMALLTSQSQNKVIPAKAGIHCFLSREENVSKYFLLVLLLFLSGCTPPSIAVKILLPAKDQYPVYQFQYTGAGKGTHGDFTLAVLSPSFVLNGNAVPLASLVTEPYSDMLFKKRISDQAADYVNSMLSTYMSGLRRDFEKILVVNGYRTIGSFRDKEKLTYPQRQQSDFALQPVLQISVVEEETDEQQQTIEEFELTGGAAKPTTITPFDKQPTFERRTFERDVHPGTVTGNLSVAARADIQLYEPVTWEKMWVKSISIPVLTKQFTYKYNTLNGQRVYGEDTRPKILADILTSAYKQILDEFLSYFDASELKALDVKGKEIREKKRF